MRVKTTNLKIPSKIFRILGSESALKIFFILAIKKELRVSDITRNIRLSMLTPALSAILAVAVLLPLPLTAAAPTGKITGSVSLAAGSAFVSVSEGLSGDTAAASDLTQRAFTLTESGTTYSLDVRFAVVDDEDAWFTGPVVSSTDPSLLGRWVVVRVHDAGKPKDGTDQLWTRSTGPYTASAFNMVVNRNTYLFDDHPITDGNLTVH